MFLVSFVLLLSITFSLSFNLISNNLNYSFKKSHALNMVTDTIKAIEFKGAGTVLVANPTETSHYMHKSCVFLYDCTSDLSQGVILQKQTAFVMGEMAPNIEPFDANPLFTGGEDGDDTAIMLSQHDLGGYSKPAGNSGIYVGGMREAKKLVIDNNNDVHPLDFKFLFKSSIWTTDGLMKEIEMNRWKCVELPIEDILCQDESFSLYAKVKNTLMKTNEWFPKEE